MCRLFGQISLSPRTASDYLAEAPRSLLRQSNARPADLQKDGWGLAYFPAPRRPRVVKSPRPIFREKSRFEALAAGSRSRVVVGHIRAASNPRGISPRRLITLANTQPFTDGTWVFCHNGTLQIPDEISRFLGPYRSKVRTLNDSEVYFWQLRKFIDARGGDAAEALKACVRETWAIWAACRGRYPGKKAPYTGLNALTSDGKGLYALCHYPSRPGHKAFFSEQPWGVMSIAWRSQGSPNSQGSPTGTRAAFGGQVVYPSNAALKGAPPGARLPPGEACDGPCNSRVVIASEDMDQGRWERLGGTAGKSPRGWAEVLSAVPEDGRLVVRREVFDPRDTA